MALKYTEQIESGLLIPYVNLQKKKMHLGN